MSRRDGAGGRRRSGANGQRRSSAGDRRRSGTGGTNDATEAAGSRRLRADRRAASVTLGYVLTLSIVALLLSGLLFAAGSFVEDQREEIVRSELQVIGQQVAATVANADRLVQAGNTATLSLAVDLPEQVGDTSYTVEVTTDGSDYAIELRSRSVGVVVEVGIRSTTDIATGTQVGGGDVTVVYDPSSGELEVRGNS